MKKAPKVRQQGGTSTQIRPQKARAAQPFSAEQLLAMRQKAGKDFLIFMLLRHTGLRRSDCVKVTWREIDLSARLLRRKTQKRGKVVEIPLMQELITVLEFEHGARLPKPEDVVILSPVTGLPMSPAETDRTHSGARHQSRHCPRDAALLPRHVCRGSSLQGSGHLHRRKAARRHRGGCGEALRAIRDRTARTCAPNNGIERRIGGHNPGHNRFRQPAK